MRSDQTGPWNQALTKLAEWDPAWTAACKTASTNPWRTGVLSAKFVELVSLAINVACTNLNAEGTRRHIRGALDAGASRDEILFVFKCATAMAIHSCSLGAPILLEEAKAAGAAAKPAAPTDTPAVDKMKAIGQWNAAWDGFLALDPAWTDAFMAMGAGMNMGPQHSQTIYSLLTAIPGLKIVIPSNAYDAKGLLIQAIRDDDPVIFFEHKALYPRKGEVPEEAYVVPFGEANLLREGEHVTVVAIARMVPFAERAVDALAKEGITCDLIDPRTTSPMDEETIIESVEGTGRLVIVDESPPRCGMACDIAATIAQKAFRSLKRPIIQVTAPHTPVPFAPALERQYVPGPARIEAAIREAMKDE